MYTPKRTTPKEQNSPAKQRQIVSIEEDIQISKNKYGQQNELNKLEIMTRFYQVIQTQRKKILELEQQNSELKIWKTENVQNIQLEHKIDKLLKQRNSSTNSQIQKYKAEAGRLRSQLQKLKQTKGQIKKQIILPKMQQIKQVLSKQIDTPFELQQMKLRINQLMDQNTKLLQNQNKQKLAHKQLSLKLTQELEKFANDSNFQQQLREKETENQTLTKENSKLKKDLQQAKNQTKLKKQNCKQLIKLIKQIIAATLLNTTEQQADLKQICSKLASASERIGQQQEIKLAKQEQLVNLVKQLTNLSNKYIKELNNLTLENSSLNADRQLIKESLLYEKNNCTKLQEINGNLTKSLNDQIKKTQSLGKSLKVQIDKTSALQLSIKERVSQNLQYKQKKEKEISGLKQSILQLNQDKQANKKEIQKQKAEILEKFKQINQLKKANSKLFETNRELQQKIAKQQNQIILLKKQLAQANTKIKESQKIIQSLQNKANSLNTTIGKLQSEMRDLNRILTKTKQLLQKSEQNLNYSQQLFTKVNKKLIGTTSQAFIGQNKILKATTPEKSKQLDKQMQQIFSLWRIKFNNVQFFNGSEVIPEQSIDWMLTSLQSYVKESPIQTKLIYRYDRLNPVNFHKYIDRVPNLLLLVKIGNGSIIGGFTAYQVNEHDIKRPGRGFIFNLNYKKVYYMRNQPRLPVAGYDQYYMILGNAQIRLRCQEDKVFSNFGIANSTFDNGTDLRTKFLGVSDMMNNELEIDTYEFYQMNFRL